MFWGTFCPSSAMVCSVEPRNSLQTLCTIKFWDKSTATSVSAFSDENWTKGNTHCFFEPFWYWCCINQWHKDKYWPRKEISQKFRPDQENCFCPPLNTFSKVFPHLDYIIKTHHQLIFRACKQNLSMKYKTGGSQCKPRQPSERERRSTSTMFLSSRCSSFSLKIQF